MAKLPCPDCTSHDALEDYGDHTYCFSCRKYTFKNTTELQHKFLDHQFTTFKKPEPSPIASDKVNAIPDRGITKETAAFYNVWLKDDGSHVYPYFSRDGKQLSANKFRTVGIKGFTWQGDPTRTGLFGQQLFPAGSAKQITLVEGELDALSVFQMTGSKFPCVSVKNAATAPKDVADNYEYLSSFEKIVVCFDKDEGHRREDGSTWFPGQEAAQTVAALFPLGKVRLLSLRDAKDANDYLRQGKGADFVKEWWAAPEWTPVGLRLAKDLWEEVREQKNYETVLYPWEGLNQLTFGIRLSEIVLITADTGVGKTSVVKEIEYHLLQNTARGIGILHLEESNGDSLLGLMSLEANKPLHIPDVRKEVKEEELRKYYVDTCDTDRIVLWDHFGSNSVDSVLTTIRHMHALGCKYIILDHLSIVVSDQSGDERKQLDEISTKLKTLCMELNCSIICVIHINRKGQIRGSAGPEQIANIVVRLERDKLADDEDIRNTTKVIVEKNRFCGRTGPACLLRYDAETGRLSEMPKEAFLEFLARKLEAKTVEEDW